ncbi:alkaline shock response membrane anchor protein AmaP [Bounagaea algeriensis]
MTATPEHPTAPPATAPQAATGRQVAAHPAPLSRMLGFERALVGFLGLLVLVAGAAVLAVGQGWFGAGRAQRPMADPLAVGWISGNTAWAAVAAIAGGVVLLAVGLWWLVRTLRPERKPDVRLDQSPAGRSRITADALARAVRNDAANVTGVTRANARMAGTPRSPGLRLRLGLEEGTDVRRVWEELDAQVLSRARDTLGSDPLPTAVRLDLDRAPRQRVQ